MRKGLAASLGVGTVAVGTWLAVYRFWRGTPDVDTGTFGNGMGYARLGRGAKSLLWVGGPSAGAPGGLYLKMMTRMLRPFVQEGYTVWLLSLKPNLPDGCTIADMAADYARLIAGEFGGKADVVVGVSGEGVIGFYLAARHPEVFGHIVIVVPGPMTEAANATNLEFARLLSAGRKADAAAVLVTLQRPGIRSRWVIRLLAWVVARVGLAAAYEPRDILVSAEALNAFDGREILPSIPVPVLLVCGEKDRWATREIYEQTADLIPECTLKMYEGKDHLGAMFDKRLPRDVLDFVQHSRPLRA
jgi:pimeloyl-ACP methyl ester carboxylesterase